jgi:uncharacterized protein
MRDDGIYGRRLNSHRKTIFLIALMAISVHGTRLHATTPKTRAPQRSANALVTSKTNKPAPQSLLRRMRNLRAAAIELRAETFRRQYGPWAVVTGASSGIGKAYAFSLAAKGLNVVLVSRTESKLEKVKAEILAMYPNAKIKVVVQDLSVPEAADQINKATNDLDVGLLINNAGSLRPGEITDGDHEAHQYEIGLMRAKTITPASLSIVFSSRFRTRRQLVDGTRGGILGTASLAAISPMPNVGTYGSSNAHMVAFHRRQYTALKLAGISSAVVVPGPVDTPALAEVRTPKQRKFLRQFGLLLSPERVAESGLNALVRGEMLAMLQGDSPAVAVPGIPWKLFGKTVGLIQAVVPAETLTGWGVRMTAATTPAKAKALTDQSQGQLPGPAPTDENGK